MSEEITISKEKYDSMKERLEWLNCLESAGVDNWQGIEYACELFNKEK